ncbi:MAG: TfoX/Sxy family protein [Acuticoccus sp.]
MRADEVEEIFADFAPIVIRRMFGGLGVYRDGLIFALVANGELFLKTDAGTVPAFQEAGSTPFVYDGGKSPVTMPYWRLPAEAFDNPDILARFTHLALEVAARAGPPKPRRKRRAKTTET